MKSNYVTLLTAALLIAYVCIMAVNYSTMPMQIPSHVSLSGKVDALSSKSFIWRIPFINSAIFFLILFFQKRPHILNYGLPLADSEKPRAYAGMQYFLETLNFIVTMIFGVLSIALYVKQYKNIGLIMLGVCIILYIVIAIFATSRNSLKVRWKLNISNCSNSHFGTLAWL